MQAGTDNSLSQVLNKAIMSTPTQQSRVLLERTLCEVEILTSEPFLRTDRPYLAVRSESVYQHLITLVPFSVGELEN